MKMGESREKKANMRQNSEILSFHVYFVLFDICVALVYIRPSLRLFLVFFSLAKYAERALPQACANYNANGIVYTKLNSEFLVR